MSIKCPILLMLSGVLALSTSSAVQSHSGGLNSQGCHAGSRPYHCHRSPSEMVRTQDGRNRLRCDLGSRSYECRQRGSDEIRVLQVQLTRHCSGLSDSFVDGVDGPNTRQAIITFQRAYGLNPDGIPGPQTKKALAGARNGNCTVN